MERVYYIYSAPDDDGGPLSVIAVKSVLARELFTTVYVPPVYHRERERAFVSSSQHRSSIRYEDNAASSYPAGTAGYCIVW